MGIHDEVKRLAGNQGVAAETVGGGSAPEDRKESLPGEVDRLEVLLFKFSGLIEKVEAERQEAKRLYQEVDTQKVTVGQMLVSLDKVIQGLPNTVDASVKASLERYSTSMDQTAGRVTSEMQRQTSSIIGQVAKVLNDGFASSVAGIKTAASQASAAATKMETAKNYVGWRIIAVNVGIALLVVFILLGVMNRRFPWQLRGATAQEQAYIEHGKALSKAR